MITYILNNKRNFEIINYEKDALIFNEGDFCEKIGFILEGSISISTMSYQENEYIINTLRKGDFFGNNLLFSNKNKFYLGDIISNSKTKVAFINKEKLLKLFSTNQTFLELYLEKLADNDLKKQNIIKIMSQKKIREKIIFYLKIHDNFKISTKEKWAKELNVPRPSLSRELIKMEKEKIIKIKDNEIKFL